MSQLSEHRPIATVYGYPRQGADRQLKKATEGYWAGRIDPEQYRETVKQLRLGRLSELSGSGLGEVPVNDFSLYDHMLDTTVLVGAIPKRYAAASTDGVQGRLDRYFAMARGNAKVAPLEMTKWFDTNYHYLVPELGPDETFSLDATKVLEEVNEAESAGLNVRPVVVGPVTFLLLAKPTDESGNFKTLDLLDRLLPVYVELLAKLKEAGCEWVQLDEPILVTDLSKEVLGEVRRAYETIGQATNRPKVVVASYFGPLGEALPVLAKLPIDGLAVDFTASASSNIDTIAKADGLSDKRLIAGVVDGRNVWTTDLTKALATLEKLNGVAASLDVAASCSLLHVPIDVALETKLDPTFIPWLAFARQKLAELSLLAMGLSEGSAAIADELATNAQHLRDRAASPFVRVDAVRARSAAVSDSWLKRSEPYSARSAIQQKHLKLPKLPTTTIGSFPQTSTLRKARADLGKGTIDRAAYDQAMRDEIKSVIAQQEEMGIDVLVHGEPERNDMVQYFAEQLDGYIATQHGWVQSYGSRYVRPPIVLGDVSRPNPMTVEWSTYAQSLTNLPVKGMLTGPVTMLAWSFVRDDQPLGETARQVALALRDEVNDLEVAGITIIQVDEPALRETLPLRKADQDAYLDWAVESFVLTTSGVKSETQIHTHMCYAEFGDILSAIVAMDADVISLEAARSKMAIVSELAETGYPNEVGPGVWDIHSPRVPAVDEIVEWLGSAVKVFPAERLWVNPDCGLKTRGYEEVNASLNNLVAAAKTVRETI